MPSKDRGIQATKQEEIREGIQLLIDGYDSTLPIDEPCPHCQVVDDILSYLHSKGVVLKKGEEFQCDYPFCPHSNAGAVVVEPLIKG